MTIEELKEKKQALEEEIADKLNEFCKETNLEIVNVDFKTRKAAACYGFYFSYTEVSRIEVNIEVKL